MNSKSNYALHKYLFDLQYHGIRLGLDNITYLLNAAGNPHLTYPTVHVAGTNGKGSVVAFLDSIFRCAGYKCGRFTSPHLITVNERFLFSGTTIPDEDLNENISYFRDIAEQLDHDPTFFEMNAAIAFRWFNQVGVDVALLEVGMGGRFDATNVIAPDACAITNIDLEHTEYLGDTLEKIAFEKAGIIKPNTPVVIGESRPTVLDVILNRAREQQAHPIILGDDFEYELSGDSLAPQFSYSGSVFNLESLPLALAGKHQGQNAAIAVALAEVLSRDFAGLTKDAVRDGLTKAKWPCRLEQVMDCPKVIIDVAHNTAGAHKIAEVIGNCVIIVAVSANKDVASMLKELDGCACELILTTFAGSRSLSVDELCHIAGDRSYHRSEHLADAIELGLSLTTESLPLVITGSVFAAGEARRILVSEYGCTPLCF